MAEMLQWKIVFASQLDDLLLFLLVKLGSSSSTVEKYIRVSVTWTQTELQTGSESAEIMILLIDGSQPLR